MQPSKLPTTIDVLANDSDANGDPLEVTELTSPAHGNVHAEWRRQGDLYAELGLPWHR